MYEELIKRLKDYSTARKGEIAELTEESADAIEELNRLRVAAEENRMHWQEMAVKFECDLHDAEGKIPKWIPVTERLPEEDAICILTNGVSNAIGYRGKVFGFHLIWTDYLEESEVTHWMPLTQPPKEEQT